MHCADFFLSGSSEDMGIFHVFIYLSVMCRYNPPPIKTKLKYVKNAYIFKATTQKKISTVHNLITFSIVFTNNFFLNLYCKTCFILNQESFFAW